LFWFPSHVTINSPISSILLRSSNVIDSKTSGGKRLLATAMT